MKRLIPLIMFAVAILACGAANAATKTIEAPINSVTVYLDQAQINRLGRINLPSGQHSLVIENLPVMAIDGSFRVSVSDIDGLSLLGFDYKREQKMVSAQEKVAELERKIRELDRNEKRILSDRLEAFKEQKSLIINLAQGAGQGSSDDGEPARIDITQWKDAYDFVGQAIKEINDSIRVAANELDEINILYDKLVADLKSIKAGDSKQAKTVEIEVFCERDCTFDLALKYTVPNASWRPVYDARLDDDNQVQFNCYADITQKTGEDWNDVALTFSTARPSRGMGPGTLAAWYVDALEAIAIRGGRAGAVLYESPSAEMAFNVEALRDEELDKSKLLIPGSVGQAAIIGGDNYAVTFAPKHRKTVPSGSEAERTLVAEWNLDSKMTYLCRPKNSQEVYRLAEITNQNDAPLMPGLVSVFAGGDFLGKTNIDGFIAPGEMFEMPFGVDNNIKVERALIGEKKKHSEGIFTDDKLIHERTIKITLKNNGTDEKKIRLEEAMPLSRDDRIKIKVGDITPEYDFQNEKGRTAWKLTLKPGEEQIVTIPLKIEHPQDVQISGL